MTPATDVLCSAAGKAGGIDGDGAPLEGTMTQKGTGE